MSPDSNVDEEGSIDDSATDDEEHDGQRNMTSPEAMRDPEETIRMTPPPTNLAIPPEFTGNAVELTCESALDPVWAEHAAPPKAELPSVPTLDRRQPPAYLRRTASLPQACR